jgi:hypothetical protein
MIYAVILNFIMLGRYLGRGDFWGRIFGKKGVYRHLRLTLDSSYRQDGGVFRM